MDKRQCIGLDKFHRCLSTLFPPNDDDDGVVNEDGGGDSDGGGCQGSKQATGTKYNDNKTAGDPRPEQCSSSIERDHYRNHHRRIPVKFTKSAVELLRQTLNAFLRKVGRDLSDDLYVDDFTAPPPIRPEDVERILLTFDEKETTDDVDDDDDSIGERLTTNTTATDSKNADPLEMKEFVSQAQNLLLQQKRQNQKRKVLNKRKSVKMNTDDPASTMKDAVDCTTGTNHDNSNSGPCYATAAATKKQQQEPQTNKRKRKRKRKIKITAEMEAEQERLLSASKKAFESSHPQHKGGVLFSVELK